jgi:hypothetical protein
MLGASKVYGAIDKLPSSLLSLYFLLIPFLISGSKHNPTFPLTFYLMFASSYFLLPISPPLLLGLENGVI